MSDDSRLPEPPSDDEIEARLRRAVERSFAAPAEDEDEEDVETRFRRIQQQLAGEDLPDLPVDERPKRPALPDDDPEFAARMRDLHDRAEAAKGQREEKAKQQEKTLKKDQSDARGLGLGISIAYTLIGLPLVGALIGWLIDSATGNGIWKGLLTLAGMTLGVVLTISMLNRQQK